LGVARIVFRARRFVVEDLDAFGGGTVLSTRSRTIGIEGTTRVHSIGWTGQFAPDCTGTVEDYDR
jgi:hypothetical protein